MVIVGMIMFSQISQVITIVFIFLIELTKVKNNTAKTVRKRDCIFIKK